MQLSFIVKKLFLPFHIFAVNIKKWYVYRVFGFTNCDFDLLTRIKFIVYQIYDYSFKEVLGGVLYYVNLKQSNKFFF